jgi:septum formation inhibitor MinC
MASLLLTGSSYLIPTLRIERNDTPQSISTRIALALEDTHPPSIGLVKSMLQGKETATGTWHAPIILDLHALVPDGSPHYTPPQHGLLLGVVKALGDYGIRVVGVTNTPPILEEEAVQQLGLPSFMSKGRVLDRQSAKFHIEDVVKMILAKTEETAVIEMANPEMDFDPDSDNNSSSFKTESEKKDPKGASNNPVNGSSALGADNADDKDGKTMSSLSILDGDTPPSVADKSDDDDDKDDYTISSLPSPEGGTDVYHGSVRSGQQVVAKQNQSLIIIGSVNSGGEVLSDRDIFVFGKLRGRALAGLACANASARIFSTSFDPELICIGDTFTTVNAVTELGLHRPGEAAMVSLDSCRELVFEHIPL